MARRRKKSIGVALAAFGATALLSAAPASAACVSAEVYIQRPNQTKQYVVGPKKCVVATPFNEGPTVWATPGDPATAVVGVQVWTATP